MRVWEWKRVLVGSSVLVACKQNFEIGTVGEGEIFWRQPDACSFHMYEGKKWESVLGSGEI